MEPAQRAVLGSGGVRKPRATPSSARGCATGSAGGSASAAGRTGGGGSNARDSSRLGSWSGAQKVGVVW